MKLFVSIIGVVAVAATLIIVMANSGSPTINEPSIKDIHDRVLKMNSEVKSRLMLHKRRTRCTRLRRFSLKNGVVRIRSRGRIAKFNCNAGFAMLGSRFATCVNGQWSRPMPICISLGCKPLVSPSHGSILKRLGGALVSVRCDPGYKLTSTWGDIYCDRVNWNSTMPTCIPKSNAPASGCDFESVDLCEWSHDETAHFQWTRHSLSTPSGHVGTGPGYDHTYGIDQRQTGHYMYIESSSPRKRNDTARLYSPVFPVSYSQIYHCFVFYYHMYGSTTGSMNVYLKKESDEHLNEMRPIWQRHGEQGAVWLQGTIDVAPLTEKFQIIIEGVRGASYVSDSAIDDVLLVNKTCSELIHRTTTRPTTSRPVPTLRSCRYRCGHARPGNRQTPPSSASVTSSSSSPTTPSSPQQQVDDGTCYCDDMCVSTTTCCPDYNTLCVAVTQSTTSPRNMSATTIIAQTAVANTSTTSGAASQAPNATSGASTTISTKSADVRRSTNEQVTTVPVTSTNAPMSTARTSNVTAIKATTLITGSTATSTMGWVTSGPPSTVKTSVDLTTNILMTSTVKLPITTLRSTTTKRPTTTLRPTTSTSTIRKPTTTAIPTTTTTRKSTTTTLKPTTTLRPTTTTTTLRPTTMTRKPTTTTTTLRPTTTTTTLRPTTTTTTLRPTTTTTTLRPTTTTTTLRPTTTTTTLRPTTITTTLRPTTTTTTTTRKLTTTTTTTTTRRPTTTTTTTRRPTTTTTTTRRPTTATQSMTTTTVKRTTTPSPTTRTTTTARTPPALGPSKMPQTKKPRTQSTSRIFKTTSSRPITTVSRDGTTGSRKTSRSSTMLLARDESTTSGMFTYRSSSTPKRNKTEQAAKPTKQSITLVVGISSGIALAVLLLAITIAVVVVMKKKKKKRSLYVNDDSELKYLHEHEIVEYM